MKIVPVIANTAIINETKNGMVTIVQKAGKITPRKLPNCIGATDEAYGIVLVGRSKFFPEDLKKMEGMSIKERLEYKKNLLLEGKVYE